MATELSLQHFQSDLRRSYVGGGPGAIVSGLVWAIAAFVTWQYGTERGFIALFIGGMFIFPIGTLICRVLFKRSTHHPENPGPRLVIETLPLMFFGLGLAYLCLSLKPEYVFPVSALAVGAHYFPFQTAYGDMTYWILGGAMMAVGAIPLLIDQDHSQTVLIAIALIELVFGFFLTIRSIKSNPETHT